MAGRREKSEGGAKQDKSAETKSTGVFVRLTQQERKKLKTLSQQSGISVSQLLRTGALGQMDQLPRFRQLPPEVTTQLTKLDRLTTALWYISQRANEDAVYAQDIRAIAYEVGEISAQVRQFSQANMARYATVAQLNALVETGPQLTLPELIDQLKTVCEAFKRESVK